MKRNLQKNVKQPYKEEMSDINNIIDALPQGQIRQERGYYNMNKKEAGLKDFLGKFKKSPNVKSPTIDKSPTRIKDYTPLVGPIHTTTEDMLGRNRTKINHAEIGHMVNQFTRSGDSFYNISRKHALKKNAAAKLQIAIKQPSDQELAGVEERYKHNVPDPASDKWKVKDKPKTFMKDKPCK